MGAVFTEEPRVELYYVNNHDLRAVNKRSLRGRRVWVAEVHSLLVILTDAWITVRNVLCWCRNSLPRQRGALFGVTINALAVLSQAPKNNQTCK